MKAVIMCGGTGTRLRPLTFERPKPSIPILNRPSVVHLVDHLSSQGFGDIVVTLGYMGEKIEEYLANGDLYGVDIEYVYEKTKLGTAGSVKNAAKLFDDAPFMVVGGDHVMDLNLRELYNFHAQNDAMISIGLLCIDDPREYGIVDMDVNNRIHRFLEKPNSGEIFSNLASTGIYVCNSEVLDWIPDDKPFDFAKDLFPVLMAAGKHISGFLVRGKWTDIGNPAAYREACRWKLDKLPSTRIGGHFSTKDARVTGPVDIGHNVSVGSNSAIVGPSMIGDGTTIGDNVLIAPYTTIGTNCNIMDDARILSGYIYNNVTIGSGTTISGAIIDNDTIIGTECNLENGTVIGARTSIGDRVTVHSDVRIWPDLIIGDGKKVKTDLINDAYGSSVSGS